MVRRRSDIDWYSVFLSAFSHNSAVDASSDSPGPASQAPASPGGRQRFEEPCNEFERRFGPGAQVDDGPHFRLPRAVAKAAVGLGPDVDVPSASKGVDDFGLVDEDEQGEHVSHEHCSKSSPKFSGQKKNDGQADVGLGQDLPSASKGIYDFSPVDEDEQGEHVSRKHCSKSSPKFSGQKKNYGQLPLNKRRNQGHGGKRKPSVNNRRAHATNPEESDYESSLPSRFSERRKQQLHNSSSVHSRKVQDVVLLDDEDMELKEEVNREMSDRLNEPKIYYPSRDDREAVVLTRSDIKCLDPEVFLSSHVINFYIKYIEMTRLCNENFREKFYIFNTYFFGKLEKALFQPRDFPKLRRWWKGVNIFNNAYIILPIHAKEHWSLVIVCLPPKEEISEPIVLHLDSLGMHRSNKILNTVGRYLEKEWRFLSVAEPAWPCLLTDIRKETVQVPQQNNAYDCGIFMLYYIEQFIKEAPARFTTDKLGMFSRSWFKPEEASGLRQRIRELLLEEFESASLHDAISKADAYVGCDSIKDGELEADNSKMIVEVGDAAKSIKGISIAESDEASGEFGDTGKTNKCIKVLASEEANMESGYPVKSMEDIADVAVVNKGPTCSGNKCNEENAGSCSDSVIKDKKGSVKIDSGSSKAEKEGKPIVTASPERLKGNDEAMGSTPIPDAVSDSGVSEGNEEVTGSSMPIPDAVCEITGTKVWITRVYRRTSGTTLEPGNWCWSSGGSSRDARRKFIEHFSRK
ncbi:unnamed protein product [Miscanthus lutarioriparius]|uniref:Ubiquitin-like protease family profile domain-containing protein n=1 Tax=Miscanthus lutarioriparius TaxID=422564 RepID=A0A811RI58_9POAL|nr:unnamed protein product [Miscanthus lutarioriparius]